MSDFTTLSCPSCGAKLEITQDIDRFACSSCGREHIVKRSGGIVSLSPVVDALRKVEVGVDKTAAELAIVRIQKEIEDIRNQKDTYSKIEPHPQKNINNIGCFPQIMFIVCIFSLMFGIGSLSDSSSSGTGVLFIFIFIGTLIIGIAVTKENFKSIDKKIEKIEKLEKNKGELIKLLNVQIAQKTLELKHFQDMVSNK